MKKKIISISSLLFLTLTLTINTSTISLAETRCAVYYGGQIICCRTGCETCATGWGPMHGPIIIDEEQNQ